MCRFSDALMEHCQYPVNRGAMGCADLVGKGSLDGCPPFVRIYLQTDSDRVKEASFEAEGCGVTIACGSILTELVLGREIADCKRLNSRILSEALGGIPPDKMYCAMVAISALHDAIRSGEER